MWKIRVCTLTLFFSQFLNFSAGTLNSCFNLLLSLSGDISLNPGPPHNSQPQPQSEWSVFNSRGLHFIHLNVNSFLPKIDELRNIAKLSNAAIIGIN